MTEQHQNSEEKQANVAEATENDVETVATETASSLEALQQKVGELEGMLKDEQLRGLANEQNLRRRHTEELQAAHKFAGQRFAEQMLPVKDYLEMALLDQSGNFEALKTGVNMTLTELNKAFANAQVTEINPNIGEKLDPHQHQAMQTIESEQEPNTVVEVMKKGYSLADRVLRPALVVVAKAADPAE